MEILESIVLAWESLKANKLRSLLTMLGIIIGVSSVITVVAIGQGGRAAIEKEMQSFGANRFGIYYKYDSTSPISSADLFTLQDIETLKNVATAIQDIAPINWDSAQIKSKGKSIGVRIIATTENYSSIANLKIGSGRFMNQDDVSARRPVVMVTAYLSEQLFNGGEAVGRQITVNNKPFKIIGVLQDERSVFSGGQNNMMMYMPISTYFSFYNTREISNIEGKARDSNKVDDAINQSLNILHRRHHNKDKYDAWNSEKEMNSVRQVMGIVALIISAIAAISLVVGGIGVMNIMLVSVTERTREIGIRKALGALEMDIMMQFLIESVVLTFIGGTIGMILGMGLSFALAKIIKIPPVISWQMVLAAFTFSAAVGIFFGLYPARRAAYQDPIEALRYE